jgi:hypothetical protein
MFREADNADGSPGPVSMRRVLAFILVWAGVALFVAALILAPQSGWSFVPGGACLVAVLILLFFTSWGDVAQIAAAWKGK